MKRSLLLVSLLLGSLATASESPAPVLKFAGGEFRPLGPGAPPSWYRGSTVKTSAAGRRYVVAVTRAPLDVEQRRRLEETGAEILDYLPVRGYRLRLRPQAEPAVRALPFVAWVGPVPAYFKVEPRLPARAGPSGESSRLRVVLAAGEPPKRVLGALESMTTRAVASGPGGAWRVEATVPGRRLAATLSRIVSLPEVEAVEEVLPVRFLDQDAVWVHQSFVGPSPQETPIFDHGIFGCGQVVSVADTGQDYGACYFYDTVHGAPPVSSCVSPPCPASTPDMSLRKDVLYYNWSGTPTGDDDTCPSTLLTGSGHGTHTSGSVAADASPYADCAGFTTPGRNGGDGLAPGAKLVMIELGDGVEYLNDFGGSIWNIADVAYRSGARIHSFSLGGVCYDALGNCVPGCTLPYDTLARDADLAMWTYPDLLLVNAAGNGGTYCPAPDSVVTPALAKNLLTVGSVGHGTSANLPSAFSSPGPVFDGRLKPTLAAQGESVVSAASDANPASNNCGVCSLDGSSMSAPTAAGLAALVREYYTAGYLAAGARDAAQGFTPSGALIKATLIDGSMALGGSAPAPDFQSGYGRIQLDSTLAFAGGPFQLRVDDHREGITTGSVVAHAYDVAAGEPFRATLVWVDPPAALNAAVARVNELKLEVTDPSGNVWFQTLDPGTGAPVQTSNSGDPHDPVNVEERLVFDTPAPGRWVVRVRGVDVPWGSQPFALVVRGALSDCPAPASPEVPALATPADGQVEVTWSAVPGASTYNVYRGFGACPGGPRVPVATGVTGTSFLDTTVSGGAEYSYDVTAASDADAACESAPSPCASVVPTGDCTLTPLFAGLDGATSDGTSTCSIHLSWGAATALCGTAVRYSVYRDTMAGFTPGPSNRIASCVAATDYTDQANLVHGTDYHYVVRAEDGTSGHGGPCNGGNEEHNVAEFSTAPDGPPAPGTWSDDAGDTSSAKFDPGPGWSLASTGGDTGPSVYIGASSALACADLVGPVLTLAGPAEAPTLSFSTIHDLDYDPGTVLGYEGSVGQVEIATGPNFDTWTRVPLSPGYPAYCDLLLNNCPSTQAINTYFSDVDMTYDTYTASLVNWGGLDVKIRFHLSGDLYFSGGNWWIDDVEVTKALVPGTCTTAAVGPPPVPDGASVPGEPLRVGKSGGDVVLTWDATRCPATAVNVYRGAIGDYTTFTGGDCDLAPSGTATLAMPAGSWFLVVATDGASTDGSWNRDASGAELTYAGASAACPAITQHVTSNGCP